MTRREVRIVHVSLWNSQCEVFAGSQIGGDLFDINLLKIDTQSVVEIKPHANRFRKRNSDTIVADSLYFAYRCEHGLTDLNDLHLHVPIIAPSRTMSMSAIGFPPSRTVGPRMGRFPTVRSPA